METILDDDLKSEPKSPDKQSGNDIFLTLPYASSVYYKGIASIPLAISIFGFIYSVYLINIAITRGKEMKQFYKVSPEKYDPDEYNKVQIGMRCAKISIAILIVEILILLIFY